MYFNFIFLRSNPLSILLVLYYIGVLVVEGRWGEQFQKRFCMIQNCKLISKTPFTAGTKSGSSDNGLRGAFSPENCGAE